MMNRLFSATVVLTLLSAAGFYPNVAQAEVTSSNLVAQQRVSAPEIDSFTLNQVEELLPGTELVFTLQGTPNARATLTIGDIARNIPMQQVEPGVYEGRYTVRSGDRFSDTTVIRANLQQGDQISSARLQQSLIASGTTTTSPNAGDRTNQAINIERFTAEPVQQLEPGTELAFTLVGTPNARASFSIDGVVTNQPMQEISPGTYRGEYVIRRQDVFPATGANVVATLSSNRETIRARLDGNLVASGTSTSSTAQLPLNVISPTNNSQVRGTVEVRGRSVPNATIEVNVQANNSLGGVVGINRDIFSRTIRADAQGAFSFSFQPGVSIPGTRYEVSLSATQGNQTNEQTLTLIQQ